MIDLHRIVLVHYATMVQVFVYLILSYRMLDVIVFDLLRPAVVEMMDLARNFPACFEIEGFVHFGIAAFSKDA